MPAAYTPGLRVSPRTILRYRRTLPIAGEVLVGAGDQVESGQVVAHALMPGNIMPVNVANLLSVPPGDVPACMLKREGERVAVGEPLARSRGIFGYLRRECYAPAAGTVESISAVTGQ